MLLLGGAAAGDMSNAETAVPVMAFPEPGPGCGCRHPDLPAGSHRTWCCVVICGCVYPEVQKVKL